MNHNNNPSVENIPHHDAEHKLLPSISASKDQIRRMLEIKILSHEELDQKKIIHPAMKDIKTLNDFRALRTKLIQKSEQSNFSIMVSSLTPEGGSTYISENLAAAFALDFERTALLIDTNSESNKEQLLSPAPEFGLTDYLINPDLLVSDVIYATGIPRLRKTPIGGHASSSSELFTADRMNDFINETKNRYPERVLIFDAPPVAVSPNARIIAELCDFTILVVPYGRVTKLQITASINSIPSNKFAGVVFNN